jgi:hypothetical protein
MMQIAITLIAVASILVGPALADEALPDNDGGRYMFSRQANGVLRLDTRSGAVSLCNEQPVGWACQATPDDRALFESDIARLQNENAALKKALLGHGLALPPGATAEAPVAPNEPSLRLPSDADIDRMIDFVGRAWQRFVDAIARVQRQIFNKS